MKRYYDLSKEEKFALTNETLNESVKLEAIERGIQLPLRIKDVVNQPGWIGFTVPGDSVVFYEPMVAGQYSGHTGTKLGFRTLEEAMRAMQGVVVFETEGYGSTAKLKVFQRQITFQAVHVSLSGVQMFGASIEGYEDGEEDRKAFDALSNEIIEDLRTLRQTAYDAEVLAKRKEQYLDLAKGDLEIAKAFWSKSEKTIWPE